MMEGSIHQEDIVVLNVYAPYNRLQNTQSKTWQSWQEKQIHPQSQLGISMYSSVIDKASRGKKKKISKGKLEKTQQINIKMRNGGRKTFGKQQTNITYLTVCLIHVPQL